MLIRIATDQSLSLLSLKTFMAKLLSRINCHYLPSSLKSPPVFAVLLRTPFNSLHGPIRQHNCPCDTTGQFTSTKPRPTPSHNTRLIGRRTCCCSYSHKAAAQPPLLSLISNKISLSLSLKGELYQQCLRDVIDGTTVVVHKTLLREQPTTYVILNSAKLQQNGQLPTGGIGECKAL